MDHYIIDRGLAHTGQFGAHSPIHFTMQTSRRTRAAATSRTRLSAASPAYLKGGETDTSGGRDGLAGAQAIGDMQTNGVLDVRHGLCVRVAFEGMAM
jgi:hypothetical protein